MTPPFPPSSDLPDRPGPPDPLVGLNGTAIRTAEAWRAVRVPELRALFGHYMYGLMPSGLTPATARVTREDAGWFDGAAVRRELEVTIGPARAPKVRVLLITPRLVMRPPVLLGVNFSGNTEAEEEAPGKRNVWAFRRAVERGIAVATFHAQDVDPDRNDFTDGIHPWFRAAGEPERGPHTWGTLAAWAWGLQRVAEALRGTGGVDPDRVGVVGHSRMGKAALLAAAFDDRIAFAIPSQSGTGGAAPSCTTAGETVRQINEGFPHWFALAFREFNDRPARLPFDQNSLLALVAPRPVLVCAATEDRWADPAGQFAMLASASSVWRLLGANGLPEGPMPDPGRALGGRVRYFLRPGEHAMGPEDWESYLDFVTTAT